MQDKQLNFIRIGFVLFLSIVLLASPSSAQQISVDLGEGGGGLTSRVIQLLALITVLSLAPSILVMVTSFTRIIVVLAFLRSALGLQQTPPNPVMISLALFLTLFIMMPTLQESYSNGIQPLMAEEITETEAFPLIAQPFHNFMATHVRENDLKLFTEMSDIEEPQTMEDIPFRVLIPSFMISELRRAFEIGFLIFIPFLIIDMLVASTLMAMGMMMLPPVMISLPFKLIFFVMIDGWHMVVGSLMKSFG